MWHEGSSKQTLMLGFMAVHQWRMLWINSLTWLETGRRYSLESCVVLASLWHLGSIFCTHKFISILLRRSLTPSISLPIFLTFHLSLSDAVYCSDAHYDCWYDSLCCMNIHTVTAVTPAIYSLLLQQRGGGTHSSCLWQELDVRRKQSHIVPQNKPQVDRPATISLRGRQTLTGNIH